MDAAGSNGESLGGVSEGRLIERARHGDREALVELLRRFGPDLRRELQRRIPQRWQSLLSADDVLQQTYTDALLDVTRFKPNGPESFRAWLRTLAEHNRIEAIRALRAAKRGGRARHDGQAVTDSAGRLFEHLTRAVTHSTPSRHIARADRARLLEHALRRLPPHYEHVVRQYDLEARPMQAIAAELDRSVGAAHLLRVRALERLRLLLSEHATDLQSLP